MTRPRSDLDKAVSRAAKSLVEALVQQDQYDAVDAAWRAMRDATVLAHWDVDEDECECFVCLGEFTITHGQVRPI